MKTLQAEREKIRAALGEIDADLVVKNARVLNVFTERFVPADVAVKDGTIVGVGRYRGAKEIDAAGKALVPGFIDGHIHLESSIITPKQFCRAVVPHGTTAVVADPHEITNVFGKISFSYMLEASRNMPLDVFFMAPSCVPATPFDESGAVLSIEDIEEMLDMPGVIGLAEMMNYPGVVGGERTTLEKVLLAKDRGMIVDGHAPRLSGKALCAYVSAGIYSDHECSSEAEAKEKLALGQWIMIREGTAGKNLLDLIALFEKPYCDRCMLVTDDKHPGELKQEGHIDHIVRKAIANGANAVNAYKMASYNAARCFGLSRMGAIAPGYDADFVLLDDIQTVKIHSVYKRGRRVDEDMEAFISDERVIDPSMRRVYHTVNIPPVTAKSFALKKEKEKVIGLVPGQLITTDEGYACGVDAGRDICKLSVIERHKGTGHIGVAFAKGYGLRRGAVATSVSHDSHNVIVIGADDGDMAVAVERLKALQGGMVVVDGGRVTAELALPIAGLMCDLEAMEAEQKLCEVKEAAYALGVSRGIDPFMTLSFSSLAVIPSLRLTTRGVVDVDKFVLLD